MNKTLIVTAVATLLTACATLPPTANYPQNYSQGFLATKIVDIPATPAPAQPSTGISMACASAIPMAQAIVEWRNRGYSRTKVTQLIVDAATQNFNEDPTTAIAGIWATCMSTDAANYIFAADEPDNLTPLHWAQQCEANDLARYCRDRADQLILKHARPL